MHPFLVTFLLGLALFKIVDLLEDLVPALTRWHTVVTMAIAVIGLVAIDYSALADSITFEAGWMGAAITGVIVSGMASAWRAIFGWLGSNEGEAPEVRHAQGLRSAA